MWRSLLSAAIVYGCGNPTFDGSRPTMLERPLQAFHQHVNQAVRECHKVLAVLDDARMRVTRAAVERVQKEWRALDDGQ
jgi:hypothetical protein